MAKDNKIVEGSKYTGTPFGAWWVQFASGFVSAITAGLAYPAMKCWKMEWMAKHTMYNGKKLVFTGKSGELFKSYLIWWLLSVVTLGIYGAFVLPVKLKQWECQHTHFEGEEGVSDFDGTAGQVIGLNIKTNLGIIFSLGLAANWAVIKRRKFWTEHQIIDGKRLTFTGTRKLYAKATRKWNFLTFITIGIYGIWVESKREDWFVSHTSAEPVA